ncbi:MAG: methyltransferase domain-containing protein [archaeon]
MAKQRKHPSRQDRKKLNIGCLFDYRDGWVNLDHPDMNVRKDVAHDLNKLPWPFPDSTFDTVLASHVIEHLTIDSLSILRELARITKHHGDVIIEVPYALSSGNWDDITHRTNFGLKWYENKKYGIHNLQLSDYHTKPCLLGRIIPNIRVKKNFTLRELVALFVPNVVNEIHTKFVVIKD